MSVTTIAVSGSGHCFSQILHPIQPVEHTDLTSLPKSFEAQATFVRAFAGIISINALGHALTHNPHEVHFSGSTTAIPLTI